MLTHPVSIHVLRPVRGQPDQRGRYESSSTLTVEDLNLLQLETHQAEKRKPIRTLILINLERYRQCAETSKPPTTPTSP